ncbi:NADH-quinone oxidoreductase subunit M [Hydrogenophaga sp.]|uniref:NADH-quinone oxidoreductase subunit M n=1 Tax=Hydrogenophaga sp. TaxID=1904254 RepID=UPI002736F50D|nr:NADH-quinone oxidoreductase subunit M [Hydrogenophaga sp.]MDP3884943.1 NADH-quinone oxidoreductase subunit M [Hydrogenophaga sp.]
MTDWPILTTVTFLPLVGVVLILLIRDEGAAARRNIRAIAFLTTAFTFLVSLLIWIGFDASVPGFQMVEKSEWLDSGISYHMGVDGISMLFVILTTFLMPLCILASWDAIEKRVKSYMIAFLILETLMIGVFTALDIVLFYVFFEAGLIPMFIIIGVWGGKRRVYASFKFFLYTLLGSVLMLLAIMAMFFQAGTTDIPTLLTHDFPAGMQTWLWLAFFASFAVKMPMWPVHTWLPDVHVEAPTGGSAVLAAIMLKLGAYGFLRFSLPILPDASHEWAWLMITLSLVAVVYVGLVAMVQKDMKKLVAYSSVAHMGFVTLGFFLFSDMGVAGGIVQMIAHGFVSAAMFLSIGVLYDRVHSREISAYGGVVNTMPNFAAFALLFTMANCGLPGTAGFVGEWMVILAAVKANFWIGAAAATALIFGAAYSLWMFKRVYLGAPGNQHVKALTDIGSREFLVMAVLGIAVLYMGVHPKPFTDVMDASVAELLRHVAISKLN